MNFPNKFNLMSMMLSVMLIALVAPVKPLYAVDSEDTVAKVVYHADFSDPRRFSGMLTSIYNMVTTYENELMDYEVRVVFLSRGIRFVTSDKLKGTPFAEDKALADRRDNLMKRLNTLHEVHGVKLFLCNITREAINLDTKKLYPGVELVTSGVVEIARLQSAGYSYLKVE